MFEKIKQENKANGHMNNDPGLFFTNLYVTPVLKNISLYLEKGKMLAVAGSTGAGKVSQGRLCTVLLSWFRVVYSQKKKAIPCVLYHGFSVCSRVPCS